MTKEQIQPIILNDFNHFRADVVQHTSFINQSFHKPIENLKHNFMNFKADFLFESDFLIKISQTHT